MISVTCSNCRAALEIDDAFAGGVCRCQHCGTIQTVPPKSAQPAAPAPKVLHQSGGRSTGGAGLDQLADAVASSGLARAGLKRPGDGQLRPGAAPLAGASAAPGRKMLLPIVLIASGALIVLLGIIIIVLINRSGTQAGANPGNQNPAGTSEQPAGPSFCGIALTGNSVIFVLDRGNSIADLFDTLKATTYNALEQLGPDRQFQIIFWDTQAGAEEFPRDAMRSATAGEIDNCRRYLQDLAATGQTHVSGPFKEALERHPAQIVVATAKPELDDDDASALRSALGRGVRVDFVQIGSDAANPAFKEVAQGTGGQVRTVSAPELRAFSQ